MLNALKQFVLGTPHEFDATTVPEVMHAELDDTSRLAVMVKLESLTERWITSTDVWGMESLKHLVVINAAGIAGAFALFQRPNFPVSITVSLGYVIGLLAAFAGFFLGFSAYRDAGNELVEAIAKFRFGKCNLREVFARFPEWRRSMRRPVWAAFISLLSFLIASVTLFILIYRHA